MFSYQSFQGQTASVSQPSRAIFLDIDGVFHPSTAIEHLDLSIPLMVSIEQHKLMRWCDELADLLEGHDDVMLFVHSTWRFQMQNADLRMALGERLGGHYQGVTNTDERARFSSIEQLVSRAQLDDYLILDDARDEFPADCAALVLCNPLLGITENRVKNAVSTWLQRSAAPQLG